MIIYSIIVLVLFIALVIVLLKLVKNAVKIIASIVLVLIIISIIFGVFLYMDVKDLEDGFSGEDKLFLLRHNYEFITGFSGVSFEEMNFLTEEKLSDHNLKKAALDDILQDRFKLFIFDSKAFEGIEEIEIKGQVYSKEESFELLESDDLNFGVGKEEAKSAIFGIMIQKAMSKDPLFIFKEYKNENLIVYPETITFKTIKNIPMSLADKLISMLKKGGESGFFE